MKLTDELVKSAMLGTSKYMPQIPPSLEKWFQPIGQAAEDADDKFYKMAAAAAVLENFGRPLAIMGDAIPTCPPETGEVLSASESERLQLLIRNKEEVLAFYLIEKLAQASKVIHPSVVPFLLDWAISDKKATHPAVALCGETGKWLSQWNPAWQVLYKTAPGEAENWETGSMEFRKSYFSQLLLSKPALAVQQLEQVFKEENAANRLAFLNLLDQHASVVFEPFLTRCLDDKSQKVKRKAQDLLLKIENSGLQQLYLAFALQILQVKEERNFLLSKRKKLYLVSPVILKEEMMAAGIEAVSSEKGMEDHVFWLGQILAQLNPDVVAQRLQFSTQEYMQQLSNLKEYKLLIPFLTKSAAYYRNISWAQALMEVSPGISLWLVLDEPSQTKYLPDILKADADSVISYLVESPEKLNRPALGKILLNFFRKEPYALQPKQYQQLALYMPLPVIQYYNHSNTGIDSNNYKERYFQQQVAEMERTKQQIEQFKI